MTASSTYAPKPTAAADIIAKDAELLDSIDLSSTMDLHRSNLMRMQVTELLEECQLDLKGRKWAVEAHEYLQNLTKLVSQATKQEFTSKKEAAPYSTRDRADKVVHIEKLPAVSSSSSKNNNSNVAGITVEPIGCTKSQFGWTKKAGNAQMLPAFSLMVKLPVEFFSPKDYLKHRYFDKRNFIMDKFAVYLAKHANKLGSVEYKWPKGSNRSPYLQLVPNPTTTSSSSKSSKTKAAKFQVHLHFGMQSIDWIPRLRLVPNRCNIKDRNRDSEAPSETRSKLIQSQLYNQSLLFDARHEFEDEQLSSEELVDHPNVEATLVLIQIWALQRGLWRNHDGWTKENVAIFLLYMLRTNRMNPRMTPIQQFTVVLQMWSTTNWLETSSSKGNNGNNRDVRASQSEGTQYSKTKRGRRDVLVLPEEDSTEKETIRNSDLARLYEKQTKESPLTNNDPSSLIEAYASLEHYSLGPVMLDTTMAYNYLGDVSPNYMKLLQFHATKGLQGLKASRSAFSHMFMKNARFWSQWDMYVKIPIRKKTNDWDPSFRCLLEKLELALGNRVRGMRVLSTGNGDTNLKTSDLDQIPSIAINENSSYKERSITLPPTQRGEIILGIAIDPETSQRVVDRGPPSDQQKQVKSFVQLWGSKAQLRRFKDGAIVQAVVWNDDDGENHCENEVKLQGGYINKIVRHTVRMHYTKEKIEFALPNLISVVDGISNKKQDATTQLWNPIVAHQNVMKAFDSLSQFLREGSQSSQFQHHNQVSLELPLTIDGVEAMSACLRYSELFPPIPHPSLGGTSPPNNKKISGAILSDPVLIQIRFGSSSKWPSDLKAIGAAKTAMLIQLAKAIEGVNNKDFDGPMHVTPNYLDLGYKGYCFRILIRADTEIKLLQGLVKPSPVACSLLKTLTRVHIVAAKHHSMIHAVHTSHPSSAGVVRLAKRWVANHMLSGLITPEAIELMVAKVYSDDETPLETPSTITAGFVRFLHLLAHHDWLG